MNWTAIWAIARKDMRALTSNIQIWLPMIILPLILAVVVPGGLILAVQLTDLTSFKGADTIVKMLDKIPAGGLRDEFEALPTLDHRMLHLMVNYTFAPLFLLIPVMASSLIASNSFVGEKERRTLESLLFAPIDIRDLFVGKVLAALLPTLVLSAGTFVLYGVIVDVLTYSMFGGLLFPNLNWIVLILWVVPAVSIATILISVLISARVKGFQEAQQLSGVIVLPFLALVVGQSMGLMFLNAVILLGIGAVLLVISALALRRIAKMNQRNVLFEKQVH